MRSSDQVLATFRQFPSIANSSRWAALLAQRPTTSVDLVRRAGLLQILRLLLADPPSRFLILKGPALAELAYPTPIQRHSLDLDILVSPDRVDVWITHLERGGYLSGSNELRPRAMNQLAFTGPFGTVELHWAVALPPIPSPLFEELVINAQSVKIGDLEALTLGPVDGAVHLALHFHQHLGDPSILMDLALWVAAFDLSPAEILDVSRRWGLGRIAELPLYMLSQLECTPPQGTASPLASLGDLLLEEYLAGRSLEGEELEGFIYQLFSMTLLPNWWRPVAHRLFLGPHRLGNLLGKQSWF